MSLTVRHRSTVAAIGTLLALVLTTVGRSPVEGPSDIWGSVVWAFGITAGLIAFVAAASVFADVAQHDDEARSTDFHADFHADARADHRTDQRASGHPT